jgi:ribose transport system substrate-binding protein
VFRACKKTRRAFVLGFAVLVSAGAPTSAETIATFTRNPSNPILRGVRVGSEIAAKALGFETVHFIPRSESPAEQLGLVDEVVRNKPDALVLAPFDPKAMIPAVEKLKAAGIPVTNVNERLAGGDVVAYVGTDDYQLALATARYLLDAMGKKGNVVILEGPENLPTSIARVKAYNDAVKQYPDVKLVASKPANYARAPAVDVMRSRTIVETTGFAELNAQLTLGMYFEPDRGVVPKSGEISLKGMQQAIALMEEGGLLAQPLPAAERFIDLQYLRAAGIQ